jgi:hypothetical protein
MGLGVFLSDSDKLLATLEANGVELGHLEVARSQLAAAVEGAKAASLRQSAFKAQFQQSTRDLEGFVAQGREMTTRLRNGIRTQYGLKGEKLAEFGLQPRRRPQKAKGKPVEPVPQPAPGVNTKAVPESNG